MKLFSLNATWPTFAKALVVVSVSALTACAPASHFDQASMDENGQQEETFTQEGEEAAELTLADQLELEMFQDPTENESETSYVLASYGHLDPKNAVPNNLLEKAVKYYDANKSRLKNKKYMSVIDFSRHSGKRRLHIINMESGSVWSVAVAHGSGSDRNHDGYADRFSNTSGSNASSLGFYRTAETYSGKHGYSLRLDGLSSSNSKARSRAVVIHGASYVSDSKSKQGRSWGCPAVSMSNRTKLINMLKGGSLIYAGLSN